MSCEHDQFVLESLDVQIDLMEKERSGYEQKFRELKRKYSMINELTKIPGVGDIIAIKMVAKIVDPNRFKNKGNFLSYCGLVKHELSSGGKTYGRRNTRYNREMKFCLKVAALAAIRSENEFRDYYMHLREEKRYPDHMARHATCRRMAIIIWGVLKSGERYSPNLTQNWKKYLKAD